MGCVPKVKLGFVKIIALLTNYSYCELYCYFLDFKKAFDIVLREVLWHVLAGLLGVEGRFLQCL
jgi:hypothetical protein